MADAFREPGRVWAAPPHASLSCAVCLDVFTDPRSLSCGHVFCRACVARLLERISACPTCRAPVAPGVTAAGLPVAWPLQGMVSELRVRCRFGVKEEGGAWVASERGCGAMLPLDAVSAHEAACPHALAVCPFAGCGAELRRGDTEAHDAASVQAHLRGERVARVACEARLAAVEAAAHSDRASFAARLAALERLLVPPAPPAPVPVRDCWDGPTVVC